MTWVAFQDQAEFDAFHDQICADKTIPHPPSNSATQRIELDKQWTTAYVIPILVNDTLVAEVTSDDAITYSLPILRNPPVFAPRVPDPLATPDAIEPAPFVAAKPLPATWVIDGVETPVSKTAEVPPADAVDPLVP